LNHYPFREYHCSFSRSASQAWKQRGGRAAELLVGGATVSITPEQPVALRGQMHTRMSTAVESPVTATVLALESVNGDKSLDQTIMVSCDLVAIPQVVLEKTA